MPVFSRTVVTAAEILRSIPPGEDDLYTTRGKLRRPEDPRLWCTATTGPEYRCKDAAEVDGLCVPHWNRRERPPTKGVWNGPLRAYRKSRR